MTASNDSCGGPESSRAVSEFAANLRYEQLPPSVVLLAKQCLVDTIAVCLGATGLVPEARKVMDAGARLGGHGPCGVFGSDLRVPATWAALVNGTLGHMLDYDDIGPGGHTSITVVPVAAVMSQQEPPVSGKKLLSALVAGFETITRLGLAIPDREWIVKEGWFATQVLGFLSGAAAAGRLLDLDVTRMQHAMGIAYCQASGSREMAMGVASDGRSLQAGFTCQGAVLAVSLAQAGMTGPRTFLEGKFGLYRNYVHETAPDWDVVTGELGTRFRFEETHVFKVWPACGATRSPVAAVLRLLNDHGIPGSEVKAVRICGGSGHTRQLMEPIDSKRRPQTSIDGKFSIPFTVATAIATGTVGLAAFNPGSLRDPTVLSLADRVSYRPEPHTATSGSAGYTGVAIGPVPTVEIETRSGQVYRHRAETVPGDGRSQLDWGYLERKFRECASFAAKPLGSEEVDKALESLARIEEFDDVSGIFMDLC